jgi:hypothetical protein
MVLAHPNYFHSTIKLQTISLPIVFAWQPRTLRRLALPRRASQQAAEAWQSNLGLALQEPLLAEAAHMPAAGLAHRLHPVDKPDRTVVVVLHLVVHISGFGDGVLRQQYRQRLPYLQQP